MDAWCGCGSAIAYPFEELGCIKCGQPCCHACGVSLESVTYCTQCARALLEIELPVAGGIG